MRPKWLGWTALAGVCALLLGTIGMTPARADRDSNHRGHRPPRELIREHERWHDRHDFDRGDFRSWRERERERLRRRLEWERAHEREHWRESRYRHNY